jgi:indolepyruvate ferredoxin oxidoreductase alpha subunit
VKALSKNVLSEGEKEFLLGNEAIVRGALEAGVALATTYPGTPASEIGDTFAKIAKDAGIYFEYSTNEKVALEVAGATALCGTKSLVSMKHYGLNVALDSLLPLVYFSSPFVLVVADDPGCWSSIQSEQDSRWISRLAFLPTLEPSEPQECKDFTKKAFELAEKYKLPIMIRLTTRVSHTRSVVKLGKIVKGKLEGEWNKKFLAFSTKIIEFHKSLIEKIEKIEKEVSESEINTIEEGEGELGIIASGVSYLYVKEAMEKLGVKLPLLKIGMSYPLPKEKIRNFLSRVEKVLVVEEIEPILEQEIKVIACELGVKVFGKNLLPRVGELKPENVYNALARLLDKDEISYETSKASKRVPNFCPGCPHRASFFAIKKALKDEIDNIVFCGDIGCYLIGNYEPYSMEDIIVSMGASIGLAHGIEKATKKKVVALIGDSTFWHAGLPALINLVFNKGNVLVIALDNRITAMTGHQPCPNSGFNALEETKALKIEEVAKAIVDKVETANAFNIKEVEEKVKKLYYSKGSAVLVIKGECRLLSVRKLVRKGLPIPKFEVVDEEEVKKCAEELKAFGCPAIRLGEKVFIDEELCWGCSVCTQLCKGIRVKK